MRIGVDVVDVARIARVVARSPRFLDRVFTPSEVADSLRRADAWTPAAVERLAGRFAAKEATRKALGTELGWRDIEVCTGQDGAPQLLVRGEPAQAGLSLAHDGGVAVAFVLVEA